MELYFTRGQGPCYQYMDTPAPDYNVYCPRTHPSVTTRPLYRSCPTTIDSEPGCPPRHHLGNIHTLHVNQNQRHQICSPVTVQPQYFNTPQSCPQGICQRVSKYDRVLSLKYLNPSSAMAKGYMKRPRHGIQST
jgi:hypothetical protein